MLVNTSGHLMKSFWIDNQVATGGSTWKSSTAYLVVIPMPNITNIFYGRDVGYSIERIVLDEDVEEISATQLRRLSKAP
jgi:hypothetical protein